MDKDKKSERPDSKTYHIYGIGEIYDKDIPKDYRGNVDGLKRIIEDGTKRVERIIRNKGLDYVEVPLYIKKEITPML